MKDIHAGFLLLSCVFAYAQNDALSPSVSHPQSPRVLTASSIVTLSGPNFGIVGNPRCDTSGNVYVNEGHGLSSDGPFLKIRSDGSLRIRYPLPAEADSSGVTAWAVTPAGDFFVLHADFKEYKLFQYRSDGSVSRLSSADLPPTVMVQSFAIADSGVFYVRGYRDSGGTLEKPRPGFAGVYGENGRLLRDLSNGVAETDMKSLANHPPEGHAIAGDDGLFYVLNRENVAILSQSGAVERIVKFQKPDPSALAMQIHFRTGESPSALTLFAAIQGDAARLMSGSFYSIRKRETNWVTTPFRKNWEISCSASTRPLITAY